MIRAKRLAGERTALAERLERIAELLAGAPRLQSRLSGLLSHARRIRVSEYHVTNSCNIRCEGCWFFEYGHDQNTREEKDLEALAGFLQKERQERRINSALVIGGEPTLFLDRLRIFVENMTHVTVSTNGLRRLPVDGFEKVAVGLTLFGGGPLDDKLRGIKPSGRRFGGLFETALRNYKDDPRAGFIYALTEDGLPYIEDTVRRIADNGNHLAFNFYSKYHTADPLAQEAGSRLLDEALRIKERYPETVVSHPYYIRALITGRSHWGSFDYASCPSISVDHPAHRDRLANGNPTLPFFNTYGADLSSVKFCCTSGHCDGCRDSQAVTSWLLVNMDRFLDSKEHLRTWIEIAESYWRQFIWGPYHWTVAPDYETLSRESETPAPRAAAAGPMPRPAEEPDAEEQPEPEKVAWLGE
jgi:hypothetical protein